MQQHSLRYLCLETRHKSSYANVFCLSFRRSPACQGNRREIGAVATQVGTISHGVVSLLCNDPGVAGPDEKHIVTDKINVIQYILSYK